MTIDEAIEALEVLRILDAPGLSEAVHMAIYALRAQQEAEKNEPLTIEELRKMDGEPVWAESLFEGEVVSSGWAIPCVKMGHLDQRFDDPMFFEEYGTGWLAYRRPPEKEET